MKSPVTQINAALKRAGREERLVRGRGYWYLMKGEASRFHESGFYAYDPHRSTVESSLRMIAERFKANGIDVTLR